MSKHFQQRIVITGGPSGGKTTLIEALKKELGNEASVVPEAASILYRGGFPRLKSDSSQVFTQKAIYYTQFELESLISSEYKKSKILVCDRGSLDGSAYWPGTSKSFFKAINSSESKELKRYHWVIHLDTASKSSYDTTNPIRTESFVEALDLNSKVKKAWENHPQRFIITQSEDFISKMTLSLAVIRMILDGKKFLEIQNEILTSS